MISWHTLYVSLNDLTFHLSHLLSAHWCSHCISLCLRWQHIPWPLNSCWQLRHVKLHGRPMWVLVGTATWPATWYSRNIFECCSLSCIDILSTGKEDNANANTECKLSRYCCAIIRTFADLCSHTEQHIKCYSIYKKGFSTIACWDNII